MLLVVLFLSCLFAAFLCAVPFSHFAVCVAVCVKFCEKTCEKSNLYIIKYEKILFLCNMTIAKCKELRYNQHISAKIAEYFTLRRIVS